MNPKKLLIVITSWNLSQKQKAMVLLSVKVLPWYCFFSMIKSTKNLKWLTKLSCVCFPDQCWTLLVVAPSFVSSRVSSKCFELHLYTDKGYNDRVYWWSFPWSHPVFTLYLGVFSPPIPSLTEVQKVRTFY